MGTSGKSSPCIPYDMKNRNVFIAGPCVIENMQLLKTVAEELVRLNKKYDLDIIFKASFDKANRTSLTSYRGPGLRDGLAMLKRIKEVFGLRILTDIHESHQAEAVGDVADIIQIRLSFADKPTCLLRPQRRGRL